MAATFALFPAAGIAADNVAPSAAPGATAPPPAASAMRSLSVDDLLFHLSFDEGVRAEFARGTCAPVAQPTDLPQRRVPGLIGGGYRFAGRGSTLTFPSGGGEPRACPEMYGPKANLFGASGTVSFWIQPLPNSHNQGHAFFRAWPIQITRNEYTHHQYWYAGKGGYIYDCPFQQNPWLHFALTWRQDEARAYFNGHRMSTLTETGVAPTPDKFDVAAEAQRWLEFQKMEWEDDCVIDEFQIFRRVLTDEEIRALFERGYVTTKQQVGNVPDALVSRPERAYAVPVFSALRIAAPITVDGDLADWPGAAHGGFVERRVGVLDSDPTRTWLACDAQHLYCAMDCPVDDSLRSDPMHVWYPTGEFLAGALQRDGDVRADDYVELVLRPKGPAEYRPDAEADRVGRLSEAVRDGFGDPSYGRASPPGHYRYVLNAKGTLLDERDGDKSWNSQAQFACRSGSDRWTAELAVPLQELGVNPGDAIGFNILRSWKLFRSSQNALCIDQRSQPAYGELRLSAPAAAAVETFGRPWDGELAIGGHIQGAAGNYTLKCRTQGFGQKEWKSQQQVTVAEGPAEFEIRKPLDKPGDGAVAIEVLDSQGHVVLSRNVPFVYVAASTVELANYPGWGRLNVNVTPVGTELAGVRASVALLRGDETVLTAEIPRFTHPAESVTFDTKSLLPSAGKVDQSRPLGQYQVVTRLRRGEQPLGEDRQPWDKKPVPEWYGTHAGVIDRPPTPWTDVQVEGTTVRCLLKETQFAGTLLPAQVVANGQALFAGPPRLRIVRAGVERVLTAGEIRITNVTPRRADWQAHAADGDLRIDVAGWIDFDGFTWASLTFRGGKVDRLTLEIPLDRRVIGLKNLDGAGLLTDQPLKSIYPGYWFGNEKAGFQYWWEDQRGWVQNGELTTVTPRGGEVVIAMPFVQKAWEFREPRTISIGWSTTPTKPVRKDWRTIGLYRGVGYNAGDYTFATPNYARPRGTEADYLRMAADLRRPWRGISCWYAFGPFMWVGAPEYADWWREWRYVPSELARPDPNSTAWGPACYRSSSSDLQIWLLDRFVRNYPQRGVYFDCMGWSNCRNEAHGCGWVDDHGTRQPTNNLLATRRHYERVYNLIKAADPQLGWVRHHDWGPNSAVAAFCDDNWYGEGYIGPIGATPEKNYYRVVGLPTARFYFLSEPWGHLTSFLTELATTAGNDHEKRAECYGKMLRAPADGKPGEWTLPRWPDYEHVAGLGVVHDMWQIGGNDLQLPWMWWSELCRQMRWDDQVQFAGYWDLGGRLTVAGGVPEQVVCSVYWRPAGARPPQVPAPGEVNVGHGKFHLPEAAQAFLAKCGQRPEGWLILTPMNNTDAEVTVTLRPDLKRLGCESLSGGQVLDIFRAFDFTWQGPPGWYANSGDPEPPYIHRTGHAERFPFRDGAVQVPVPKRSFRALLVEPQEHR